MESIAHHNNRRKPSIGVFIGIFGDYQDALCNGIAQVAKENDVNVIFFAGAALNDAIGFRKHWNAIYDLASPVNIDGLIVFTAAIKEYVSLDELTAFFARYASLPTISIYQELDNTPSVMVDSNAGLQAMMDHLIGEHGYRRIAFIKGPDNFAEANNRFRAYQAGLEKHGIPFDPDLVAPGNFMPRSGVEAVKLLLDERQLHCDAILAANDGMIFGAWQELNQRGIDVPSDIALAGFDDVPDARFFAVPLTTVSTTLFEQGQQSAQILINHIINGKSVESIVIDTKLVIRESCGCSSFSSVKFKSDDSGEVMNVSDNTLDNQKSMAIMEIQQMTARYFAGVDPELIVSMMTTFFEVFQGRSGFDFLTQLKSILRKCTLSLSRNEIREGAISNWHVLLPILRERIRAFVNADNAYQFDELLHQTQITISEASDQAHFNLGNWAETELRIQSEMIRDINTASNVEQIADILAENLPKLGINTAALALYNEGQVLAATSRLAMLCHEGKRILLGIEGYSFVSEELIPSDIISPEQLPFLSVHPLVASDIHFGFLLLEMNLGDWSLYNTHLALSEQIGAALYSVLLQEQVKRNNEYLQKRSTELAEANQELDAARKQAELANEVKSSFLAAMSHELRTPLNGIVNFTRFVADGLLGEINEKQEDALRKAVSSSKHLLALINDVLDISKIESGSLKLLVEEQVDLLPELTEIAATANVLLEGKAVEFCLEIDPKLPAIRADRRRIKQIILNLVSNSCKFTDEGSIVLRAIEEDQTILISVKDSGPGIPKEEQSAVFETFRQTEVGIRKGGGTGLGLPISQRLAEAHGGELWLESDIGAGATFFVRIPIKSESLHATLKERL